MIELMAIQIGEPQTYDEGTWTTGIFKQTVEGAVSVLKLGIEGDGVADTKLHGGIDKAVLAYCADHFPYWNHNRNNADFVPGAFGENLTLSNINEEDACIGDQWQFGEVVLEISQPRQPCATLARKWNNAMLPKQVASTGKTGWYFRVIEEGKLTAGDLVTLKKRPHPDWTITRANKVMYDKTTPQQERLEILTLPQLSKSWHDHFSQL